MSKAKQKDPFWTSYSDLMTSLFFVMLVLFIICLVKVGGINTALQKEKEKYEEAYKEANADKEDLENILRLEDQFKVLSESSSLKYDSIRRMFMRKIFKRRRFLSQMMIKLKLNILV